MIVPGAKEIFAKHEELMKTFVVNRGYSKADTVLFQVIRADYVIEKMKTLRQKNKDRILREYYDTLDPYESAAKRFYDQYGTSGEF